MCYLIGFVLQNVEVAHLHFCKHFPQPLAINIQDDNVAEKRR